MAAIDTRPSNANVVGGFSERFNYLLDRARFPKKNRMTLGAERFDVVPNTFGSWMKDDKIPGKHSTLLEITQSLLREIPGSRYNAKAVVAWLLAGDAVPNPFDGDSTDTLTLVDLYLQISEIAKHDGIDFSRLPRGVQNVILKRVRAALPQKVEDGIKLDRNTVALITAMLETAKTMKD